MGLEGQEPISCFRYRTWGSRVWIQGLGYRIQDLKVCGLSAAEVGFSGLGFSAAEVGFSGLGFSD